MSIYHNIAKVDEAKWWEQNYNLCLLNQQNDMLQPMCVIWFTDNAVKKTTATKGHINKISFKYVTYD